MTIPDILRKPMLALMLTVFFISSGEAYARNIEIKIALVAPEGSTWTNTLYEMAKEVDKQTQSEVTFKIFAGGVSGDEADVLRKMRVNLIH
ncbi:TRAP transporter substrate-binding protein DctP, partial [Thermodesulfobacteriota bacterium]